jgi:hypothetical protein
MKTGRTLTADALDRGKAPWPSAVGGWRCVGLGLALAGALSTGAPAAIGATVISGNQTFAGPFTLTGPLVAAGSLTFEDTLDGGYPMVVAGNLHLHGDVGGNDPLSHVTAAGQVVFYASYFESDGEIVSEGILDLRQAGASLSAGSWEISSDLRLAEAGTYTIRATHGDIVIAGFIQGPSSGHATLRLETPQGSAVIANTSASNVSIVTDDSPVINPVTGRLINISSRGRVGTGEDVMIVGFVVTGGNETVLVRAVGPTLASHGVVGVLAAPAIRIVNAGGQVVATNDGWSHLTAAGQADLREFSNDVGAFPLEEGSLDCALLLDLPAGLYTMVISGQNGTTGVALGEVYEVR